MALQKVCTPVALVLYLAFSVNAHAEDGRFTPYVALRASMERADANQFIFNNGHGVIAAGGVRYKNDWRGEISISRRESDITSVPPIATDGYFRTWAFLVNIYYHPFGVDRPISPYVGVGGGFNHAAVEAISDELQFRGMGFSKQTYFEESMQGKLGVGVRLRKGLYLDVAGAYFVSNDHQVDAVFSHLDKVESAYRTYSGIVGFRLEL